MNIYDTLDLNFEDYIDEYGDNPGMSQKDKDTICNDNSVALMSFLVLYGLGLIFVIANLIRTECCPRYCKKEKREINNNPSALLESTKKSSKK